MSFGDVIRAESRRAEVFRKGLVTGIDQTVSPWLATVNGRRMPYIHEAIAVGDVVYYADTSDPFAWVRTVPDEPGDWIGPPDTHGKILSSQWTGADGADLGLDTASFFVSDTARVFGGGQRWTSGVVMAFAQKQRESIAEGSFSGIEFPYGGGVAPSGGVDEWYKNLGDNELSASTLGVLGADDMCGFRVFWDGRKYKIGRATYYSVQLGEGFTWEWLIVDGTAGVRSR